MNDRLENFITQNRDKFDGKAPRPEVWDAIDQELGSKQKRNKLVLIWKFSRIAAGVLFLLSVGAFSGIYFTASNGFSGLAGVSPEMAELESFYKNELNRQQAQLVSFSNFDPTVNDDLAQLEAVMEDLRKELAKHPERDNEVIINAMIRNYQTRIEILEKVMLRMKSMDSNSNKIKEDEKNINI